MKPMLLTDCLDPEALFKSDDWIAEEKLDGDRMILQKIGNVVRAWSRNQERSVPDTVLAVAMLSDRDFTLDGELMPGGEFIAFDDLEREEMEQAGRVQFLRDYPFRQVGTWEGERQKRAIHEAVKGRGGEGIVFKRRTSTYRQNTRTADWQRLKNYETETFTVGRINIKKCSFEVLLNGVSWGYVACGMSRLPLTGESVRVRFEKFTENGKLLRARLA